MVRRKFVIVVTTIAILIALAIPTFIKILNTSAEHAYLNHLARIAEEKGREARKQRLKNALTQKRARADANKELKSDALGRAP